MHSAPRQPFDGPGRDFRRVRQPDGSARAPIVRRHFVGERESAAPEKT